MSREQNDEPAGTEQRALSILRTLEVPEENSARAAARRARLLTSLTAFADGARRSRPPERRWLPFALAALASAVFAFSWFLLRGTMAPTTPFATRIASNGVAIGSVRAQDGTVVLGKTGSPASRLEGRTVPLGSQDWVETFDGHAELSLGSRATVVLEPNGRLELTASHPTPESLDEQVALSTGTVRVRVPKLPTGSRLVVDTPNAEVVVHGTAFTVSVHPGGAGGPGSEPTTTVSVTEGRVSVRSEGREIFLDPGMQWSSARMAEKAVQGEPQELPDDGAVRVPSVPSRRDSTLAEENTLFRAALAARRSGDPEKAIGILDKLLQRFPTSPLAAEARAERSRAETERSRGAAQQKAP